MRIGWIIGGLLLLTLFVTDGAAQETQLLEPVSGQRMAEKNEFGLPSRLVRVNQSLFQSHTKQPLTLDLFQGDQVNIVPKALNTRSNDGGIMVGRLQEYPRSEVIFSWDGEIAAGTVNLGNGKIYRLRHVADGEHVFELLPPHYLPEGEPILPTEAATHTGGDELNHAPITPISGKSTQQESDGAHKIDILVLYTAAAEAAMGGTTGTQNTLALAEVESNQGFGNSLINMEFNIVHSHKVDFDESTYSFSDMLSSVTSKTDGIMDNIHAIRDFYGADIVTLIVDRPLLCGKTYQNTGGYSDFSQFAFVVVHQSCMTGYYSFSHEIGHVMGSQHNRTNATPNAIFQFGYGYQDPTNQFRTIMAYNCPVSCTRINYWSNPGVYYNNVLPTGISTGSHNSAHNSLSLAQMAPIVAQFRSPLHNDGQPLKINFQPQTAEQVDGYVPDTGSAYGDQSNGYVYGWSDGVKIEGGGEGALSAELTYLTATGTADNVVKWEMHVPNGVYKIRLVAGGQSQAVTPDQMVVEDQLIERSDSRDGSGQNAESIRNFDEEVEVEVVDGSLTITGSNNMLMLNLIEVDVVEKEGADTANNPSNVPFEELTQVTFLPVVR